MKIKICGMTQSENVNRVVGLDPDLMGFIFHPGSKRYMADKLDTSVSEKIPRGIKKVGVFVNASLSTLLDGYETFGLDALQLHGTESPEFCEELKSRDIRIIKAFSITQAFNFKDTEPYLNYCDFFLFDTSTPRHGGSGLKFDWKKLEEYNYDKPFFLSGGISPEDANTIKSLDYPLLYGVDLNSRFEIRPGIKDIQKLRHFINELRNNKL